MMHTSTIYLMVLSVAAALVSARPNTSYLARSFWMLSGAPYKRQSSSVPSQCNATCDPVYNEESAGCPPTACCTQSFETSFYNCLLCVGTADNATDYSQAQADLDNLYLNCYNLGYPLQELTFPGQNPSRTLSTSASIASSASVASSPATSTHISSSITSSVSKSTVNPSSTTSPSSTLPGTAIGSSTATSSASTSTGAAMGVMGSGEREVWALAAAVVGLVML